MSLGVQKNIKKEYLPMNLIITNTCNRACPYCFARNKVHLDGEQNNSAANSITLDSVHIYLDFLSRSQLKEFKILGGEPTLHPEFCAIVDAGLNHPAGLNVVVFTNGLWPEIVRSFFSGSHTSRVKFVVNINEPRIQKNWENGLQAETLAIAGQRATIGYNIFHKDFDLLFAADLIDRFKLKREMRIGLASPIVGADNDFLCEEALPAIGTQLVEQLKELEKKDILGGFDCGFPLCMFNEKELGALILCTRGFKSACEVVIDVGPDLDAWPCFPLSKLTNVKITDFENVMALRNYFKKKLMPLFSFGGMNNCLSCKYLRRNQCSGGCISRTLVQWQKSGDKNIVDKLNALG
jgi:MoaA/NifB/PqqE/SkfB family radical SAM enzyme